MAVKTLVVYPNANPETVSVDGFAERAVGSAESWSTIRSGAGNNSQDSDTTLDLRVIPVSSTGDTYLENRRVYLAFATSAIGSASTVLSATLELVRTLTPVSDPKKAAVVLTSSTAFASATAMANADYGKAGTTSIATTAPLLSTMAPGSTVAWTLNPTGLAAISKTGVTYFGLRYDFDLSATNPFWSPAYQSQTVAFWAADKGGVYRPKLTISYDIPSQSVAPSTLARNAVVLTLATGVGGLNNFPAILARPATLLTPAVSNLVTQVDPVPIAQTATVLDPQVSTAPLIPEPFTILPVDTYAQDGDVGAAKMLFLRSKGDEPVNLSNASSVLVHISTREGTLVVSKTGNVSVPTEGSVTFDVDSSDYDGPAEYRLEVEVLWGGTGGTRFPSEGYARFHLK